MAKAKKTTTKKVVTRKAERVSALTIVKKETEKLSPNQAAFNKLTSRIEKLRNEIARKEGQLDEAIQLFGQTIPTLEAKLFQQRHQLLLLIWPFYQQKKLPKAVQPYLKDMLQEMISEVLQNGDEEPDEEFKAIFLELEGEDYESVLKREEKEMQQEMRQEFKSWGVNMEWDEKAPLSEEEMAKKLHEFQQQMHERLAEEERHQNERFKTRAKTEKQLQKEKREQEAEQLKQKNITTIYRQLAKLFHPDLEQDADRRLEKEALMKSLTEAYETKNLHALLMLELKWIHNENSHLESLTEEKLSVYLEILRSQAAELKSEKWQMLHHPRYHALVNRYGFRPLTYPVKTIKEDIAQIEAEKRELQRKIAAMQEPHAIELLKKQVQDWRLLQQQQKQFDLNDLLGTMFSNVRNR